MSVGHRHSLDRPSSNAAPPLVRRLGRPVSEHATARYCYTSFRIVFEFSLYRPPIWGGRDAPRRSGGHRHCSIWKVVGCALTFYGFIIEKAAAHDVCVSAVCARAGYVSSELARARRARVLVWMRAACATRVVCVRVVRARTKSGAHSRSRDCAKARCALKGFACVVRADTRVFVLFYCIHSSHTRPWVYTWPQMHTRPRVSSEAQYS